ncbi:hypothetical protein DFA_00156 [Cavenderia fasciculata]|uniref:Uncharacterized protein n=1 Tax=Cavenderia fasciculata TaxID=261658 RepID=F4PXR8_CACFS|nr:uncharacterized protein DFA_00156 [Cavenderia fasciculata]EGG19578.1 hypothetical protein DFA_00156 [Cavenderia fasciculata]|eukprot:XP_004357872.1 hypothetical protein DFA_00156 [Cavenderia fasciculata]
MDIQLFQSIFIVNSYTRVIIKHVQQINRLLTTSSSYDQSAANAAPVGYYKWYQLTLEQKYENYKWFKDDDHQQQDIKENRKWIPNLKDIIESLVKYPLILKNHGDLLNKPYQDNHQSITKKNQFIQEFMYKRYGLDNLKEFMKAIVSFLFLAGDLDLIEWIDSLYNGNVLHLMFNSAYRTAYWHKEYLIFSKEFLTYIRDRECTTLINQLFDKYDLHETNAVAIIKKCIKSNHPRVIEIIQFYAQNEPYQKILFKECKLDILNFPDALPIVQHLAEKFSGTTSEDESLCTEDSMKSAIEDGDVNLVRHHLEHTSLTVDMELAAGSGNIEILEMGKNLGGS